MQPTSTQCYLPLGEATGEWHGVPGGSPEFQTEYEGGIQVAASAARRWACSSVVSGGAGKTASQTAANGVPVTITGTSANPIITPDVGGMLKNNAASILSAPKNGGQKLVASIGGIFGGKKK